MKTPSGFLEERRMVMTVQHVLFVIMIMACMAMPRHQINCLFPLNVSVLFLQMSCLCAEISFAHNFTRFLNEENGQTAFPFPHTHFLCVCVTVSNDNTCITRQALSWPAQVAGRFLSSLESMVGPWGCLQNRDRAWDPWDREPCTLMFTIRRPLLFSLGGVAPHFPPRRLPQWATQWQNGNYVTTMTPH